MIVLINGREGPIQYFQMTTYKRNGGKWNSQTTVTASRQLAKDNTYSINCTKQPADARSIHEKNKNLRFEFNGEVWYKATNDSSIEPSLKSNKSEFSNEKPSEIWKEQKYGSWIWVESNSSSSNLLTDLVYSFQEDNVYKKLAWRLVGCSQTYFPGSQELKSASQVQVRKFLTEKISKLGMGKWIDTEKFCNRGYERNIDQDDLKNLKLFCAKPITSS